jgi:endonuclease/exonuclease/phosphatase (EEP) superfamily protein YafD
VLTGIVVRLGLFPVTYEPDARRRAFGLPLDHVFVRGFKVGRARAPVVTSSDHNPILVILETPP